MKIKLKIDGDDVQAIQAFLKALSDWIMRFLAGLICLKAVS